MIKNKKIYDKLENNVPHPKGGATENGYKTGGVTIECTDPSTSQKVTVKGTKTLKKQTATWY